MSLHSKYKSETYKQFGDGSEEVAAIPIRIIKVNVPRSRDVKRLLSVTVTHVTVFLLM